MSTVTTLETIDTVEMGGALAAIAVVLFYARRIVESVRELLTYLRRSDLPRNGGDK